MSPATPAPALYKKLVIFGSPFVMTDGQNVPR